MCELARLPLHPSLRVGPLEAGPETALAARSRAGGGSGCGVHSCPLILLKSGVGEILGRVLPWRGRLVGVLSATLVTAAGVLAPLATLEKSSRRRCGGTGIGAVLVVGRFRRGLVPLLLATAVVAVGGGVDGGRIRGVGLVLVGRRRGCCLHSVALTL